jgi:hypothetical protein
MSKRFAYAAVTALTALALVFSLTLSPHSAQATVTVSLDNQSQASHPDTFWHQFTATGTTTVDVSFVFVWQKQGTTNNTHTVLGLATRHPADQTPTVFTYEIPYTNNADIQPSSTYTYVLKDSAGVVYLSGSFTTPALASVTVSVAGVQPVQYSYQYNKRFAATGNTTNDISFNVVWWPHNNPADLRDYTPVADAVAGTTNVRLANTPASTPTKFDFLVPYWNNNDIVANTQYDYRVQDPTGYQYLIGNFTTPATLPTQGGAPQISLAATQTPHNSDPDKSKLNLYLSRTGVQDPQVPIVIDVADFSNTVLEHHTVAATDFVNNQYTFHSDYYPVGQYKVYITYNHIDISTPHPYIFTVQSSAVNTNGVKIRKPSGVYGNASELDYTTSGTSILLAGVLRSTTTTQYSVEVRYKKTGSSDPLTIIPASSIFSQVAVANQEYPINVTISPPLIPSTSYDVTVARAGSYAMWSATITTEPPSVFDHISTGGPYGTNLLPLDPNCALQPIIGLNGQPIPPPPITGRCIDIVPNNDLVYASSGTASGTANLTAKKSDDYSLSVVWGDSSSNMTNLYDLPVYTLTALPGGTTMVDNSNRIVPLNQAQSFPYHMDGLTTGHTYWYTFVDSHHTQNAYMSPRSFVATIAPQGTTTGGTSNGGSGGFLPHAPLVGPGNLVPCDGSMWQPCKFTHLMQLLNNAIKWIIIIAIPIAGIGFAYIGFLFIAKGGSEESRSRAKHVIINMTIGIIFILGGWLVVNLILDTLLDTATVNDYKLLEQQ